MTMNVLNTQLQDCCIENHTGFLRNGRCDACEQDLGQHTVCALMSDAFLAFSKRQGNDLTTPREEYDFPGLRAGDRWCICLGRWLEALEAGVAPKIYLRSTHESVLEHVELDVLQLYACMDS